MLVSAHELYAGDIKSVLVSAEQIAARTAELGAQVGGDYAEALEESLATAERQERLGGLKTRMPKWEWEETRREILSWARDNAIDAEGLRRSREQSLEGLREHNDSIRGAGHFDRIMTFLKVLRDLSAEIAAARGRPVVIASQASAIARIRPPWGMSCAVRASG